MTILSKYAEKHYVPNRLLTLDTGLDTFTNSHPKIKKTVGGIITAGPYLAAFSLGAIALSVYFDPETPTYIEHFGHLKGITKLIMDDLLEVTTRVPQGVDAFNVLDNLANRYHVSSANEQNVYAQEAIKFLERYGSVRNLSISEAWNHILNYKPSGKIDENTYRCVGCLLPDLKAAILP
jgi:hypothetical protein